MYYFKGNSPFVSGLDSVVACLIPRPHTQLDDSNSLKSVTTSEHPGVCIRDVIFSVWVVLCIHPVYLKGVICVIRISCVFMILLVIDPVYKISMNLYFP